MIERLRVAVEAMDLKMTRYGDGEWVTAYIVPAGPWHRILGMVRGSGQHFHSDSCYAIGPGDTEILVCKHETEAPPLTDAERRLLAQVPPQPSTVQTQHECVWCLMETRNLFAEAFNATNAVEAWKRGEGSEERMLRKVAELRRCLDVYQPRLDAHFAACLDSQGRTP